MRRHSSYAVRGTEATAMPKRPSRLSQFLNNCGALQCVVEAFGRLHHLKTEHQFLGRYSIEKLTAFHEYQQNTSSWRVALVLLFTPLPTLLTLIAMDAVPMNDPRAGPSQNAVCFVRSVLSHGLMTFVCMLPARQALRLDESGKYSLWRVALIALFTCITIEAVWIPLAFGWRFPVPFRELLGAPLWCAVVVFYHRLLASKVFSRRPRRTRLYLVIVSTQMTLFYGFLGLSMGFARVPTVFQVLLVVVFPFVKIALKRFIWKYARQLDDISTDVSVCMVEISGSLYQTVCLQFASSKAIGVVIILMDFVQALIEVRAYLVTEYIVDARKTLETSMAILRSSVFPGADERPSLGTHYSSTTSIHSQAEPSRRLSGANGSQSGVIIRRRTRKPIVSSVFMQPKLITTHAARRLIDLGKFDFDNLDGIARGEDQRQQLVNDPSALSNDDDAQVEPISGPTSDLNRDKSENRPQADSQPGEQGVSKPVIHPRNRSKAARAVSMKSIQAVRSNERRRSSFTNTATSVNVELKTKSISGLHAKRPNGSLGHISRGLVQLSRRCLIPNARSSFTHPQPTSLASAEHSSTSRRGSTSKVQPEGPQRAVNSAPASSRSSSSQVGPAHSSASRSGEPLSPQSEPGKRVQSFDRRRRSSTGLVTIDGVQIVRKDQARILEQTLQLLFSCEVLLFIEYMEVVMPVLYATCISTEWALPNGKYNMLTMHMDIDAIISNAVSSIIYASLELLSLLILNHVVQRKYGISALHLLAFIVETYALTLQGKLIGAFIVILNTATLHQGVDVSFTFDYNKILGIAAPMPTV